MILSPKKIQMMMRKMTDIETFFQLFPGVNSVFILLKEKAGTSASSPRRAREALEGGMMLFSYYYNRQNLLFRYKMEIFPVTRRQRSRSRHSSRRKKMTISDSDLEDDSENAERDALVPSRPQPFQRKRSWNNRCFQNKSLPRLMHSSVSFQDNTPFYRGQEFLEEVKPNGDTSIGWLLFLLCTSCVARFILELLTNVILDSFREQVDWQSYWKDNECAGEAGKSKFICKAYSLCMQEVTA